MPEMKPDKTYRFGKVEVAVYMVGDGDNKSPRYVVNAIYRDKNGEWRRTRQLSLTELATLGYLIDMIVCGTVAGYNKQRVQKLQPKQHEEPEDAQTEEIPF